MTATLVPEVAPEYEIPINHIGPVWEENPDWDGVRLLGPRGKYVLPEFTLGYQVWEWVRGYPDENGERHPNLLAPDASDDDPRPFTPTFEQYRFVLWWYAVDENGRFLFRRGVLQRLKGWGKDPLAAVLAMVEMLGPCRFKGWATRDLPRYGTHPNGMPVIREGDPVGEDNPNAWVQVAAVTKFQTQNTMNLFPGLISETCKRAANMREDSIGITKVTSFRGRRQIQAVTSNPRALEGGRPTFVIKNETEHWVETNNGWDMDAAIDRNAAKSKGGAARALAICNAPEPSEDSVGLRERLAYLSEVEGNSFKTGVLYDSLELPEHIAFYPPEVTAEELSAEDEPRVRAWLSSCIKRARGDSFWLDAPRLVDEILDVKTAPSISRRFYFNQTVASEDAWVKPEAVDVSVEMMVAIQRHPGVSDQLRLGWEIVHPHDPVVIFFDGSKSSDATGIVGCRISDGYCFTLGIWQPPADKRRRRHYQVPRSEVDARVEEIFERFTVVGFFADPSHAKDDEDAGYWNGLIDDWHRRYKGQLEHWAVKSGHGQHSIMWDMASPLHQQMFTHAAETVVEELEHVNSLGEPAPQFTHDGHPRLKDHLKNARKNPTKFGVSMRKETRDSIRKIDLAVCLVGARMLRRLALNTTPEPETRGGWAYAV